MKRTIIMMSVLFFIMSGLIHCGGKKKQQWGAGDYGKSNELKLDMDAVQKAFQEAKGPEDFETQVNNIYTGNDVISIFVDNQGKAKQNVTLYIDNQPANSKMDGAEKIITLTRNFDETNKQVQYSRHGYGPYGYYSRTSPFVYVAAGAYITYWTMNRRYYYTSPTRITRIRRSRGVYRKTPSYRRQMKKTRKFSSGFKKNAGKKFQKAPRSFSKGSGKSSWGAKSKGAGSWGSGSKKANTSKSWGSSSSKKSSWGSSKSKGFGSSRSRSRSRSRRR